MEEIERARVAKERAARRVDEVTRRHTQTSTCPVCRNPARVTDWCPLAWIAVEDCGCVGYFVWTPLLDEDRLTQLAIEIGRT